MPKGKDYPGFDGWEVEHEPDVRRFLFVKPHPTGKPSKRLGGEPALTVQVFYGDGTDPEVAYAAGVRDAYAEDVRVSPPDDAGLWQERFEWADRLVVAGKVRRGLADGTYDRERAVERMAKAGLTFAEMAAALGEEG